jgi:hypothetical protein
MVDLYYVNKPYKQQQLVQHDILHGTFTTLLKFLTGYSS